MANINQSHSEKLKNKIEFFIIVFIVSIIVGCNNVKYENIKILNTYSKKGHYGYDKIFFRVNNKFTRTNSLLPFYKKEFYGSYLEIDDTIFLNYENKNPKDELLFFTQINSEQIKVFQIYERWNYDTISKESTEMIIDTVGIKYIKIKEKNTN
ncbi:hypothetical protein [Polaribacter sp. R77954]|uniref:hypothetical protein n=1 Tax=Polaribacter sp. R77954 TaxID=3093870 RepID=UPI0037CBBD6D